MTVRRVPMRRVRALGALCLSSLVAVSAWAQKESPARTPGEIVALYGAAWGEPDDTRRLELLEQAWADDGVYTDPTAEVKGRDALAAHIGGFLSQMPGARIVLTSGVDSHHGYRLRFSWKMVAADGETTLGEGIDYGELDEDGRLRLIVGFFGPFPPLSEP